jgi:hypothetical protein
VPHPVIRKNLRVAFTATEICDGPINRPWSPRPVCKIKISELVLSGHSQGSLIRQRRRRKRRRKRRRRRRR